VRQLPTSPDVVILGVDALNDGLGRDSSGHRILHVRLRLLLRCVQRLLGIICATTLLGRCGEVFLTVALE
jgi:hypothetical protein